MNRFFIMKKAQKNGKGKMTAASIGRRFAALLLAVFTFASVPGGIARAQTNNGYNTGASFVRLGSSNIKSAPTSGYTKVYYWERATKWSQFKAAKNIKACLVARKDNVALGTSGMNSNQNNTCEINTQRIFDNEDYVFMTGQSELANINGFMTLSIPSTAWGVKYIGDDKDNGHGAPEVNFYPGFGENDNRWNVCINGDGMRVVNDSRTGCNLTVFTSEESSDYKVDSNGVRIVYTRTGYDYCMCAYNHDNGNMTFGMQENDGGDTGGNIFFVYMAREAYIPGITGSRTVETGTVFNVPDGYVLDSDAVLTIEPNATLCVNDNVTFFCNGKIRNYGTILINSGGTLRDISPKNDDSGEVTCYGGDTIVECDVGTGKKTALHSDGSVIIMSGGLLRIGSYNNKNGRLILKKGTSFVNSGKAYIGAGMSIDDAYFENRRDGVIITGHPGMEKIRDSYQSSAEIDCNNQRANLFEKKRIFDEYAEKLKEASTQMNLGRYINCNGTRSVIVDDGYWTNGCSFSNWSKMPCLENLSPWVLKYPIM